MMVVPEGVDDSMEFLRIEIDKNFTDPNYPVPFVELDRSNIGHLVENFLKSDSEFLDFDVSFKF